MNFPKISLNNRLLLAIILLAFFLRLVDIADYPVGLNADEASFGYDAYSILRTGRDQWGQVLPLSFKSFGEYKTPLYVYLDILPVALFGLNTFSIRLPAVIVGSLAVLMIYLLSNRLFPHSFGKSKISFGIITAFLLAINPWAIMTSRGAFESGLMSFFIPAGIYFFVVGLKKPTQFYWSALFFGLSLFTYHSAKLITPLIILIIIFFNLGQLRHIGFKKLLNPVLILLLFFISAIYSMQNGGANRIAERSITNGALIAGARAKIELIDRGMNPVIARLLHNKYQVVADRFIQNYLQNFSLKFLFTNGAGEGYYGMVPGIGVLYVFEGVALLGLIFLIKRGIHNSFWLIIIWLFIAPLPSALSTGAGYSGHRAVGMLIPLQILVGLGVVGWIGIIKSRVSVIVARSMALITGLIIVFSISRFLINYFQNIPTISYEQMLSGNLDIFSWVTANSIDKQVVVSRSLSEPQIFIAFVNQWDPADFQNASKKWDLKTANVAWLDQLPEYSLGKYTIKSIDWGSDVTKKNIMLVARPSDFPTSLIPDKIFYYKNGNPSAYIKTF